MRGGLLPPKGAASRTARGALLHIRGQGTHTAQVRSARLFLLSPTPSISGIPKLQNYPHFTAHPLSGGVQSGEKPGHSPFDSSGDTLGASGAGSGWGRGGGTRASAAPLTSWTPPSLPASSLALPARTSGSGRGCPDAGAAGAPGR